MSQCNIRDHRTLSEVARRLCCSTDVLHLVSLKSNWRCRKRQCARSTRRGILDGWENICRNSRALARQLSFNVVNAPARNFPQNLVVDRPGGSESRRLQIPPPTVLVGGSRSRDEDRQKNSKMAIGGPGMRRGACWFSGGGPATAKRPESRRFRRN